jgi:GNAT superfamily N-acetyltransferase
VTDISAALREFAEEPEAFIEAPAPARRITTPRYSIVLSPSTSHSTVSRVRTTAQDLDATIDEIRATLREHGYVGNVWYVGPSCRPAGLADLLKARGFVPAERPPFEPAFTSMALVAPPPPVPEGAGIEARLVGNLDEYVQALRIGMEVFQESEEASAAWLAAAPALWAQQDGVNRFTHIAFLDGRPVAFGFAATAAAGVMLGGSGVLEAARGRGVYRALLAARWLEATKIGKPGLVIHAGAMSRPILERCGFEALCHIDALEDPAVRPA